MWCSPEPDCLLIPSARVQRFALNIRLKYYTATERKQTATEVIGELTDDLLPKRHVRPFPRLFNLSGKNTNILTFPGEFIISGWSWLLGSTGQQKATLVK